MTDNAHAVYQWSEGIVWRVEGDTQENAEYEADLANKEISAICGDYEAMLLGNARELSDDFNVRKTINQIAREKE